MREPALIRMLPDGCRLHLHDGPIDLVVEAKGLRENVSIAHEAAARRFVSILDELCAELSLVRSPVTRDSRRPDGTIARSMHAAVLPYSEMCFITPMAAVAGSVAEAVLQSMIVAARLDRAYVNNGGDIAIHLSPGQSYRIGMVERPDRLSFFGSVEVSSDGVVRGIATSGWHGRSFSLGIADAVTVLARCAAMADAAATIIANAVDLPGHAKVQRVPARSISPDSDLGERPVTTFVGELSAEDIMYALDQGAAVAEQLRSEGLIHSAALLLQGETRIVTMNDLITSVAGNCERHRSLAHA